MAISIYAILFTIICKWMNAFKIGVERKAKIVASVILGIITTNFIEILVSMAITGQFRFALNFICLYFLLSVGQSVVLALLTILMITFYRFVVPPTKLLEVVGDSDNNLTAKMNGIRYKYNITDTVYYEDEKLYEKLDACEAVLINDIPAEIKNDIVKKCFEQDKRVYVVPKLSDIIIKSSEDLNVVDTPLFLCKNLGIKPWQRFFKRIIDIVLSGVALIVLSPLFLITAIAIKIEDHGPVFFKQERVTLNEKRFMILKFRSMIVDAEKDGRPHPAGEKDDRITKVGRIIRACRVDELPQLLNILKGDMSIVGPRPERWEHVEKYTSEIPEFSFRHKVKGGLT
jgi:lipopolysaccharide/colanic/teichoic acid biosynthesis glycosyltransferase